MVLPLVVFTLVLQVGSFAPWRAHHVESPPLRGIDRSVVHIAVILR